MTHITIDPLNARCGVCDRKVKIIDYWEPFGRGIRHSSCRAECRGCGDPLGVGDEVLNETGDAFCEDCAESLTIEALNFDGEDYE